jgi:oligopeptide transport system substrate-binding protein
MSGSPEVNIARALFEGLVTLNPYTLDPEPGVAQSWTISDDGRVYTFHINPKARWSNGDPITSEDFVWSWQRALDPKLGNVGAERMYPVKNAEPFAKGEITDPTKLGVRALDPLTLEFTLNEPTPFFLHLMRDYAAFPVHRETIERFGKQSDRYTDWTRVENIVSNGPFKLKEWKLNRRITVEKNEAYWNADKVSLSAVVYHPIDNIVTEERMFRAKQLHYTEDIPLGKLDVYKAMAPSPLKQAPYLGTYYYMFNTHKPPTDDARVRRALAMAVDRETLAATVLQNIMIPSYSFTPEGIPGYQPPKLFSYDPEGARKLMAEAGYPNGANWPGVEITYNTRESHHKVAVAIQQMWKKALNIDVTIVNMEWKVYLDTLHEMQYEVARAAWIGGYLDPATFLGILIADGGNNRTGFANARYDELVFQQAPKARSMTERLTVFHEAETVLLQEMPIAPLFSYTSKHLIQSSVKGLPPNVLDTINLRYVSLETEF